MSLEKMNLSKAEKDTLGIDDRRDALIYLRYITGKDVCLTDLDKGVSLNQSVNLIKHGKIANCFHPELEIRTLDKIVEHIKPGLDIPDLREYKNINVAEAENAIQIFNGVAGISSKDAYRLAVDKIKKQKEVHNESAINYIESNLEKTKDICLKTLDAYNIGEYELEIVKDIFELEGEELSEKYGVQGDYCVQLKHAIRGMDINKEEDCKRLFVLYYVSRITQNIDTLAFLARKGLVELGTYSYFVLQGMDVHLNEDNFLSILLCVKICEDININEKENKRDFLLDLMITVGKQSTVNGYFMPQHMYLKGEINCNDLISVLSIRPFFYNDIGILTVCEDYKGLRPTFGLAQYCDKDYKAYTVRYWYNNCNWFKSCLEGYGIKDISNYSTDILYLIGRLIKLQGSKEDIFKLLPYLTKYDTLADFKTLAKKGNFERRLKITKQVLKELSDME